jgi:hypothetical protein
VIERLAHMLTAIGPARTEHTAAWFGLGMLVMQFDRYRHDLNAHLNTRWPNERSHAALLMLAALYQAMGDDDEASARQLFERAQALRFSRAECDRLAAIVRRQAQVLTIDVNSPVALHRYWREAGPAGIDACLLALARYLAAGPLDQDEWVRQVEQAGGVLDAYFRQYQQIVEPPVLVDGRQLMDILDLKPGPQIGEILAHLREAQVTGTVQTVNEALEAARAYLSHQDP